MAKAEKTEVFNCTPAQLFDIIKDFEKYPEFLKEVSDCKVIEKKKDKVLVEYTVDVVKKFTYRLWMTLNSPKSLEWELDSGDIFKTSVGSWHLKDLKGKTEATYKVEATFKIFVPGPLAKALVSVNLPAMMMAYHQRIKEVYK